MRGVFRFVHKRDGKVLRRGRVKNLVTTEGASKLALAAVGSNQFLLNATRYVGLIDGDGFGSVAHSDTAALHPNWTEFTDYSQSTRPGAGVSANESEGSAFATITALTITAAGTVKGFFVVSVNTKGSTTGFLWSAAELATELNVEVDDTVDLEYTFTGLGPA